MLKKEENTSCGIEYRQILDSKGLCDEQKKPSSLTIKEIISLYTIMRLSRRFDEKLFLLQRQGVTGTYASSKGHEAVQVASVRALNKNDWIIPYFRDWSAYIAKGYPLHLLLQYNAGDERGMSIPKNVRCFSVNIPVASQIPHAVGMAWGFKKQGKKIVVLCYLGDGATSKGEFHEALNIAGVFKIPVIFICENNQYAISLPVTQQTASKTLAQKAFSYGIRGVQVDGNDVFAVYTATKEARNYALKGMPTLIECVTYRLSDHTTADDATKYRTNKEVEQWKKKDPLLRLQLYMVRKKIWDKTKEKILSKKVERQIEQAIITFKKVDPPLPSDIFDYTYKVLPPELLEQKKVLNE